MSRIPRYAILAFLAVSLQTILLASPSHSETTGAAEVNPRLVSLGSPFEVTLTISADEDIQVQRPAFPTPQGVNLVNPRHAEFQESSTDGTTTRVSHSFVARYACDEPGAYEIGPFSIMYTTPDGESAELSIDSVTVEVYEDAPRPASDIILGRMPWWWTYLIVAVLLAMLAALVAAWIVLRRKRQLAGPAAPIHIGFKSPEQAAHEQIKGLEVPAADDEPAVKEYYDAVDGVLRNYLTKRYNVPTRDATCWEIRREFHRRQRLDSRVKGVFVMMIDCDWVKFAMTHPTDPEIRNVVVRAADILLGVKPGSAGKTE